MHWIVGNSDGIPNSQLHHDSSQAVQVIVLDSQLVRETHFKYPNNFHNYFSNEILEN
jgi:hypothetical protein